MKKLFMVLPAFVLAMAVAASASAFLFSDDELKIKSSNSAVVTSNTSAASNTGGNHTGMNFGGGNILTGSAGSLAKSHLGVNSNLTAMSAPCNCYDDVTVKSRNSAIVLSNTSAASNTGSNGTMFNVGGYLGGGNIMTGGASSAAGSWTVVNSNVTALGSGYSMP